MESFDCKNCSKEYDGIAVNPYTLPCKHTYCKTCIQTFNEVCPQDRKKFVITDVKQNDEIISFMSRIVKAHRSKQKEGRKFCEKHQQSMKVFCKTCVKMMCSICVYDNCGHSQNSGCLQSDYNLRQEAQQRLEELRKVTKKKEDLCKEIDTLTQNVRNYLKKLDQIYVQEGEKLKKKISDELANFEPPKYYDNQNLEHCIEVYKKFQEQKDERDKILKMQYQLEPDLEKVFPSYSTLVFQTLDPAYLILIKSKINPVLGSEDFKLLRMWLGNELKKNFKLLYKGTRDGMSASRFHELCDNKGPTISVINSNYNKIFGGFNPESWTSRNNYVNTTKAFLFSITNQMKYECTDSQQAIFDYHSYGPTFGAGHDIYINFQSNQNYCNKHSYNFHNFETLTGAYNFVVQEIEVYSLV